MQVHLRRSCRAAMIGYPTILSMRVSTCFLLATLVSLGCSRPRYSRLKRDDTDVNECLNLSTCGQLCHNTHGSFICSCLEGYQLQADGRSCRAKGDQAYALYAHGTDVRRIDLEATNSRVLVRGLQNATAVDYHFEEGYAFYLDTGAGIIGRANLDGTRPNSPTVIVSGVSGAVSLSLDWINRVLYWTDAQAKTIERVEMDGSNRDTFLTMGSATPGALVVDPVNKYIFWTDVDPIQPKIERMNLNGTDRLVIVNSSLSQPFSLTIDYVDRRLFFGDDNQIESVDLDGRNRVQLSIGASTFSMAQFEESVFWTGFSDRTIHRINKYTGADFVAIVATDVLQPYDLHVVHALRQPLGEPEKDECALGIHGCEHYCTNTIGSYYCSCFSGYILNANQRTCSALANCGINNGGCSHQCIAGKNGSKCACPPGFNILANKHDCEDIDECATGVAGCSHYCMNRIGGFRCSCPAGTSLGRDKRTCEGCSINNGGCDQLCVTTPGGQSFHCLCHGNYRLDNGKKCKASGPEPYLLIADDTDIQRMNFDGTGYSTVKDRLFRTSALDIHYQKGKVYYSTQERFRDYADLYEMDLATYAANKILSNKDFVDDPKHIAVDWVNDKLYWTDVFGVMRANLNGSNPEVFIKAESPFGVAVDPYLGKLFFTDLANKSHPAAVYEVNLDGSGLREFYSGWLFLPYAVAIDYVGNKVYWGDAGNNSIWYADLDGSNVRVFRNASVAGAVYGLTVFEESAWWTDKDVDQLKRALKTSEVTASTVRFTIGKIRNPSSLQVVHPNQQPGRGFRDCLLNQGGCSHVCVPTGDSYACQCPDGFELESDNRTCKELPPSPTIKPPCPPLTCNATFQNAALIPTFQIPVRQNGVMNSNNSLQFGGIGLTDCMTVSVTYQDDSCNWISVPYDIIYASNGSIHGQHVDNLLSWELIEDKLVRLTFQCTLSVGGQSAIQEFCTLFRITLVAPPQPTTPPPPPPNTIVPTTVEVTTQAPATTQTPNTIQVTTQTPTARNATTQGPMTVQITTETPTPENATTQAPTTVLVTTEAPTPENATTQAPTTVLVTTEAPTPENATTQAPTTVLVTTETPTPENATTQAPTTLLVTTEAPTPVNATTQAPTTALVATETPTPENATTQAPTPENATTETPTIENATTLAPTPENATTQAPTPEKATTEAPTTAQPQDPCQVQKGGCSDICTSSEDGQSVICSCPQPKILQSDGKTCKCPEGFFGEICNRQCQCENGATCDSESGMCFCTPDFTGEHCRTAIGQCTTQICLNGGTCQIDNGAQVCTCTAFWEGSVCGEPRPIPPECFTRTDVTLEDCIVIVSGQKSNDDSSSESSVYIAIGILLPMIIGVLIVFLFLLDRRRSQMKQNVQVDHTIIENPTYGALPGGGGRELGQAADFDNPIYNSNDNLLGSEDQKLNGDNFDNPIYAASGSEQQLAPATQLNEHENGNLSGDNNLSTSNGVSGKPTESAYETLSRVKTQSVGDSFYERVAPVDADESSDVKDQTVSDEYETPTHGTHI